jgi:hypothetical protein
VGRTEVFFATIKNLESWLKEGDTDSDLTFCIGEFLCGRGSTSMLQITSTNHNHFHSFGRSQDKIYAGSGLLRE